MEVVIIGSGSVATHLGLALKEKGIVIKQVFSRNPTNAEVLAKKLETSFITDISDIYMDAEIYFYALKDNALKSILRKMDMPAGIHVHTGGTIPMSEFEGFVTRFGVFYPLQTFSVDKPVDFSKIPICIEASNLEIQKKLVELSLLLTENYYLIDSEHRKKLHLAAVFACNFTNYMYDIASEILIDAGMSFDIIKPLILETAQKVDYMSPYDAQTGPALRMDTRTIARHLRLMEGKNDFKKIYKALTKYIHNRHTKEKKKTKLNTLMSYMTKR